MIAIGSKKFNSRWIFYALMSLFWLTLVVRNFFGVGIPVLVFLVYALAISFLGDRNEMLALAISCVPLSTSVQYKCVVLIIAFFYLLKYYKEFTNFPLWALFGALIMLWELFHFATLDFSITEYLRSFTELLFCMLIFASPFREYDYSLIRTTLAISTIVVTSIIFLNILKSGISLDDAFSSYYRFGDFGDDFESYAGQFNPNELGFICNLSIVALLQEIYCKKRQVLNFILIAVLLLFGILTLSRAFLVCFALIVLLFVLAKSRQSKKKKNLLRTVGILALTAALLIGAFFLFTRLFPSAYAQLVARFSVDDISNGRFELWDFFNEHIFSSFENSMFGIGLQNVRAKIKALYGITRVPHNGFQELLVIWGVPGLLLVIGWLWSVVRGAWHYNKRCLTIMNLLPLILFVLKLQSGQFFRSGKSLLAVLFAFISLCQIHAKKSDPENQFDIDNKENL